MDKEQISWKLIDKYFKDNPNCLVSHHLESFNDFFKSGFKRIFHENNPIRFIEREEQSDIVNKRNECLLYLGGKEGNNIYYGKPVIYDDNNIHYMFPNDARLRNMTYGITIHYDVDVIFNYYVGDELKIYNMTINKVYLGRFPIMIQSDLCILNGMSREVRFNAGECRNDYGGYFIIDGKEKAVIPQEKFADNMLYIRKYGEDDLYSYSSEIRSVSEDSSKPIRTTSIKIVAQSTTLSNNQIVVAVPNVKKPIPLFILMRALGIISDKEIIETCLLDIDKNASMVDLFIPSVHDANKFFTQQNALQFIAELTKRGTISSVIEILSDYFLPHIGELNFLDKAYFIGYMVYRLLKVYTKEEKPTDRDNFRFKRIELPGTLIYDLFREYYLIQKKDIARKIDEEYYYHKGSYKEDDNSSNKQKKSKKNVNMKEPVEINKYKDNFIGLIESNIKTFFKDRIVEQGFKKAFKGNWGSESHTKRLGVVQDLNRLSWYTFISHLRKINLPLDSSAKVVGPRLLNSSQWGFIDPIDTPDGGNIGLHKHLSISTYITSGSSAIPIIKWIRSNTPLRLILECCSEQLANSSKVFVNGSWIGVTDVPVELINMLKLYRRNGILPVYTSLSFDIEHNEVYVYTDAGRLTRPIYYIEDGKISYERSNIVEELNKGSIKWENIISGFMKKEDEGYNSKNNIIYEIKKLYPSIGTKEEAFQKLKKNMALVDYIDTAEEEVSLISITPEDLKKNKYYTHMEIDPSLILGVMGNLVIYTEYNPSTRNAFSCGQSKQAVSVYHSNYQMRIDKMGVVLNYGQTPLIKSRYLEYINHEEQPYGVNAIVAIMAYTGYNVEDAMLINEGSILRGMFRTTYYSMYEAKEESSKVTGENNSKFANIEKNNVIGKKKGYDYSFLDDFGLIRENTELNDKMIVIGKINSNLNDKDVWIDDSVKPKKGQLGFVDKSFITLGEEGFNVAKVRLREERIPAIGDKMACALPTQQVLTNKGWVEIRDIDIKIHKVATLDINGNMCYEYPINKFIYDHKGKMYSVKNKQVEVVCTLNHKLYVSRETKFSPKTPSFDSLTGDTGPTFDPHFDLIEAEKIFGENIKFKKNMNNVYPDLEYIIIDNKKIKCDEYLYSITKNDFIFNDELPDFIWEMSKKQCLILLNILKNPKNISLQLAKSISRFYVHCGFSGLIEIYKKLYQVYLIEDNEPLINNHIKDAFVGENLVSPQIFDYDGKVYCIEMPSSHLYYMRESNFAPSMLIGNSRAGQKGTIGLIIPEADMPYLEDGTRPDLIINPHAIPSRMTIGQIIESLFGIACVTYGGFGDCTSFQVKGSNYSTYGPMLTKAGFNHTGNHIMYNGMTGEQIQSNIYMGPTYYMRLKHMVKDKINYRARGPNQQLTRQPVQGRANDGGLRIGEMERDSICSHGLAYFLNESFLIRGDEYYMAICNKTGAIAIYNEAKNLFLSPYSDGPINFHTNPDGTMNIKNLSKFGRSFSLLRIPYSFKLLIQELQVMNIQMRIITDENVDQLLSMSYSNNINKLLHKEEDRSVEKMDKLIKEYARKMAMSQTIRPQEILFKTDNKETDNKETDNKETDNKETENLINAGSKIMIIDGPYSNRTGVVINFMNDMYRVELDDGKKILLKTTSIILIPTPESPPYAPDLPSSNNPESPPYAPDLPSSNNPESPPYAPDLPSSNNQESPPYAPDLPTPPTILEIPKENNNSTPLSPSEDNISEDKKVIEMTTPDSSSDVSTLNETKKIIIK